MRVEFVKIEALSEGFVQFFTVRLGTKDLTEFEEFDAKPFLDHEEEINLLCTILGQIADDRAKPYYFKNESSAEALPRVSQSIIDANDKDFGVRLYCKRITDNIVVLLNGDIKTKQNPKECPNVSRHFNRALRIGTKIDRALKDGEIDLNSDNPFYETDIDV